VPYPLEQVQLLDELIARFAIFINKTGELALRDSTTNIRLNECNFREE
jgi:hypothetical protein